MRWDLIGGNPGRTGGVRSGLITEREAGVLVRGAVKSKQVRRDTKSLAGRVKECEKLLEGRETIEMDSPLEPPSGTQHLGFSPVCPFGTSDPQNWKVINLYCVKPLIYYQHQ